MGREAVICCHVFRTSAPGTAKGKCLLSKGHGPAKSKGRVRTDCRYGQRDLLVWMTPFPTEVVPLHLHMCVRAYGYICMCVGIRVHVTKHVCRCMCVNTMHVLCGYVCIMCMWKRKYVYEYMHVSM